MAGAELLGDVAVILGALVGVADHQLDRRAGGLALEDARQDLDLVGLAPLGGVFVLPGLAPVEPVLDRLRRHGHARRAAIHRGAQRGPVAFAPGRDAEEMAEGVEGHETQLSFLRPELAVCGMNAKPLALAQVVT
jgi:hypothetical protein